MEKQDPAEVAPNIYKVPLENDRVRVLDIHMQLGDKSPQHSHPAHVVYVTGSKVKYNYPDREFEELKLEAGQAMWSDEVTHEP